MQRERLPQRRRSVTSALSYGGVSYAVTIGLYRDGRPGEVFVKGAKTGSEMDGLLDDAAVCLSLLLQAGAEPATLARSMGRLPDGLPASPIGLLVDHVNATSRENASLAS